MTTQAEEQAKQEKKQNKALKGMFETISDEINIFKPEIEGESVMGKIVDYGISKEYKTPFLILVDKNGVEITVFIKMGIAPKFHRKKWIDRENQWIVETADRQLGKLIAFMYVGLELSERTNREFHKYKIAFPDDLKEAGIIKL